MREKDPLAQVPKAQVPFPPEPPTQKKEVADSIQGKGNAKWRRNAQKWMGYWRPWHQGQEKARTRPRTSRREKEEERTRTRAKASTRAESEEDDPRRMEGLHARILRGMLH